jgi:GcrA cell cycle regulator
MTEWTDKKIEKLKKLWEKGLSTAEIGKKLDFSKNAIVGKVHRLGLSNRGSPIKNAHAAEAGTQKPLPLKKPEKEQLKKPIKAEKTKGKESFRLTKNESAAEEKVRSPGKRGGTLGVSLLDLTLDMCCWPIEDPGSENFRFCGRKVYKNKPYCLEHCAVAYTNSSTPMEEKEADEGACMEYEKEEV